MEITGGRSFDGEIGDVQIFTGGKQAGRVMIYVLEKGSPTKKTWYWLYLRQLREACVKQSNQLREANEGEGRREGSEEREGKAKGDGQGMGKGLGRKWKECRMKIQGLKDMIQKDGMREEGKGSWEATGISLYSFLQKKV